jgi:hypothetical protein
VQFWTPALMQQRWHELQMPRGPRILPRKQVFVIGEASPLRFEPQSGQRSVSDTRSLATPVRKVEFELPHLGTDLA